VAAGVAITGCGVLSPLGVGWEATQAALQARAVNLGPPTSFDASLYDTPQVAEVPRFDPKALLETPKTYLDRCSALTLASCYLAVRDAELAWRTCPPTRRSLSHGTAFGCLETLLAVTARLRQHGTRSASPMLFTHAFINSPASLAAIEYSIQGPAPTFAGGRLAGAEAIEYAMHLVSEEEVDFCLAGGAEALSEPLYAVLEAAGELERGLVPAEAAVLLVLEPLSAAEARGARVRALLRGCAVGHHEADALAAAGATQAERWQPPVRWGDAFGAQFPLLLAACLAAPDTQGQRVAIALETSLGAAAALVEVVQ
jgi:3-oxoacyl-[acyl-carrier-protein] synthase II